MGCSSLTKSPLSLQDVPIDEEQILLVIKVMKQLGVLMDAPQPSSAATSPAAAGSIELPFYPNLSSDHQYYVPLMDLLADKKPVRSRLEIEARN